MAQYTNAPFREAVCDLLADRGWTRRELSAAVGVDPAHISRLLRRGSGVRATPELLARVACALGVEPEYFAEHREWLVVQAVRANPSLREGLYARLVAREAVA